MIMMAKAMMLCPQEVHDSLFLDACRSVLQEEVEHVGAEHDDE